MMASQPRLTWRLLAGGPELVSPVHPGPLHGHLNSGALCAALQPEALAPLPRVSDCIWVQGCPHPLLLLPVSSMGASYINLLCTSFHLGARFLGGQKGHTPQL
jgi:hypothetical protein